MKIELDALSGRPNPTWQLTEVQAAELLSLLEGLPEAAEHRTEGLGYRGFVLHRPPEPGAAADPVRVYDGTVQIGSKFYADTRGAEAWLMRSARANGWAAIVDSVPPR